MNKKPLRVTLVLSGLLHAAGFYFLFALAIDSPARVPQTAAIKVQVLIKKEKPKLLEIARAPEPIQQISKTPAPEPKSRSSAAPSPSRIKPTPLSAERMAVKPVSSVHPFSAAPVISPVSHPVALHPQPDRRGMDRLNPQKKTPQNLQRISFAATVPAAHISPRSQMRFQPGKSVATARATLSFHVLNPGNEFSTRPVEVRMVSTTRGALQKEVSVKVRVFSKIDPEVPQSFTPVPVFSRKHTNRGQRFTPTVRTASLTHGFREESLEQPQTAGKPSGEPESHQHFSALELGKLRQGFVEQVWGRVAEAKYYPRIARKRGFEGRPVVSFTLGIKGDLFNLNLAQPSNHELLNKAALETVRRGMPYPPIPGPLEQNSITFRLPISYILEQ